MAATNDEHPGPGKGRERSTGKVAIVTGHTLVVDGVKPSTRDQTTTLSNFCFKSCDPRLQLARPVNANLPAANSQS